MKNKERGHPLPILIVSALLLWGTLLFFRHQETILQRIPPPETPETVLRKPERLPVKKLVEPAMAIIIDDWGYRAGDLSYLDHYLPLTLAVLPNLPHSREIADYARISGYEVMLHLPMAPREGLRTEEGTIRPGMSKAEIITLLEEGLASVGPVRGVNNHMGSLATTDPELMRIVLTQVKQKNLFFVDSVTTPNSVVYPLGQEMGLPVVRRDIFLDNEREVEYIKKQLRLLIAQARRQGRAIGIGHPHPETFAALREMRAEIAESGVTVAPVSTLLYSP